MNRIVNWVLTMRAGAQSRARPLLQLTWLIYAIAIGALTLAGRPIFFDALQKTCDGGACLTGFQLSPTNAQALQAAGFSLRAYANYNLLTRGLILPIVTFGLAALLIWRKPDDRVASLFAFVLVAFSANNAQGIKVLSALYPTLGWVNQSIQFIQGVGFVPLYCLFPDGRWVPHWSKWVALAFVLVNLAYLIPSLGLPSGLQGIGVGIAYTFVPAVQIYRYRKVSTWTQRQQTKWIVFSWALFGLPILLTPVWLVWVPDIFEMGTLSNLAINVYAFLAMQFIQAAFVIAILRYHLFDIDLLINRTLVYGALTAFVVGAYALVVGAIGAWLHVEGNIVLSLIATGLVAIAFNPVRERLQRAVNRLMYGERDDPYAVLSRFGQRLEMTLASDSILPTIVETITQTLKLPYAALHLNNETAITHGALPPNIQPESFPLVYQGEPIGQLEIAPRAAGESFTPAERRLVTDLAHQAGVAAHAVRLTADLQQARERLVTTREEERRRLRRDLHDGLGPKLAGQALILEAVRDALEPDSPSRALVNHLIEDSQNVVSEIRELVHGLRPPALDEFGLVGAVRALAAQSESGQLRVTVTAPDPLPPLSAAVEVAAYRITQEALTNVVKHAHATECQVRLDLDDSTLRLEVQDNGLGLPATRRPGVGLHSMRERAEEIGGQYVVEAGNNGGTCVTARLPVISNQ